MKRILVVDDPAIRLLYEEELAEEGYDVFAQVTGTRLGLETRGQGNSWP